MTAPERSPRGTISLCGFDLVDQPGGFEIGDDALARDGAIEPAIRGGNGLVEVRIGSEDVDHRQAVPLAHRVVVEVVRRRDLHAAAAERRIDIRIGDDRNFALSQRQPNACADDRFVTFVVGMNGHGGVAEHRFRSRRCDHHVVESVGRSRAVAQRIAEVPEAALFFFVVDFEV